MATKPAAHAILLRDAFKQANTGNLVALSNVGRSQDEGWDEVREEVARRDLKTPTAVFWHRDTHQRAFDKQGNLTSALVLHWSGDKDAIATLLQSLAGIEFVTPKSDLEGFVVRVAGASRRPSAARTTAVIEYLGQMELTPEVLLDDAARDWLIEIATNGAVAARLALLGAVNNEHDLPAALIGVFLRDEAALIDEDSAFDYLNMIARNDQDAYRKVVTAWAHSENDWRRYEAAFMLGDKEGKLAERDALPLLDRLMQDADESIVENAVRSWMLYKSERVPEDRIRLCIELLNDTGRSNLIKRFAAANVSLVSEMTKSQATEIIGLLDAQAIQLEKTDFAHYKKRVKKPA